MYFDQEFKVFPNEVKMKAIIVFVVCAVAGSALASPLTEEQKERAREHIGACMAETGLTQEAFQQIKGGDFSNVSPEAKVILWLLTFQRFPTECKSRTAWNFYSWQLSALCSLVNLLSPNLTEWSNLKTEPIYFLLPGLRPMLFHSSWIYRPKRSIEWKRSCCES